MGEVEFLKQPYDTTDPCMGVSVNNEMWVLG